MTTPPRHLLLQLWTAVGIVLALAVVIVGPATGTSGESDRSQATDRAERAEPAQPVLSATVQTGESERDALNEAWARRDRAEYAMSGALIRRNDGETNTIAYREARRDDRFIRQIGPSAVLGEGGTTRICHQDPDRQFLCTASEAGDGPKPDGAGTDRPRADSDTTDSDTTDSQRLNTEAMVHVGSSYEVSPIDFATVARLAAEAQPTRPGRCWEARAVLGAPSEDRQQWGRRSWFCFDDETGALLLRHTVDDQRTETEVARIVTSEVNEVDLAPSPTLAERRP